MASPPLVYYDGMLVLTSTLIINVVLVIMVSPHDCKQECMVSVFIGIYHLCVKAVYYDGILALTSTPIINCCFRNYWSVKHGFNLSVFIF
jgi:hypothetical protein